MRIVLVGVSTAWRRIPALVVLTAAIGCNKDHLDNKLCEHECDAAGRVCNDDNTAVEICAVDEHGCYHLSTETCSDSCREGSCVVPKALDATAISAGGFHTCALVDGGGVVCWGWNQNGQLGDGGANESKDSPVNVSGIAKGIQAIEAGGYHTCALTTAGAVKCWGWNQYGQLGDNGAPTDQSTPVDVVGLSSGVTMIRAGLLHTCAIVNGGVKCWGSDQYGQLGDGGTFHPNAFEFQDAPVDVVGLTSGVISIDAGGYHTCAILTSGALKCWGLDIVGELGDGGPITSSIETGQTAPVDVVGMSSGVESVALGMNHSCALLGTGAVKCWGSDMFGQLGNGSPNIEQSAPVSVLRLPSGVDAISAGRWYACALISTDAVECWGMDGNGELGDGDDLGGPYHEDLPVSVVNLTSGVVALASGCYHNCFLLDTRAVMCTGWDIYGQLGDAQTEVQRQSPVTVIDLR